MRRFAFLVFGILILTISVCEFTACSSSDDEPIVKPQLVSSTPTNGATEVAVTTTTIEVTYNCNIKVSNISLISFNNAAISQLNISITGTKLTIKNISLEKGLTYTLSFTQGAIVSYDGDVAADAQNISFSTVPQQDIVIDTTPVTTLPSDESVNLYNFLLDNYGKKILSATMANVSWNINEAKWVYQHTQKYPAIATFDYIHLPFSPANWIDYSDITVLKDWWNNNGIVSAGWHWIVPTSQGSSTYTYKPDETTFSAANATIEGTWENDVVKADLAEIAGYLKLLKDNNIPVIWRPLHEASGNVNTGGTAWFWWGYSGAEAYKKLWIYMFNYFEAQGLNNLIWVWTTQTNDNLFYPGDNYVDIIGRDIYNNQTSTDIATQFSTIQEAYPNKMVTLSECGNVANISTQWTAGATWSYIMPWYDYDRTNDVNSTAFTSTDHVHANADWWQDAMNQSYVITRDEMPSLK